MAQLDLRELPVLLAQMGQQVLLVITALTALQVLQALQMAQQVLQAQVAQQDLLARHPQLLDQLAFKVLQAMLVQLAHKAILVLQVRKVVLDQLARRAFKAFKAYRV